MKENAECLVELPLPLLKKLLMWARAYEPNGKTTPGATAPCASSPVSDAAEGTSKRIWPAPKPFRQAQCLVNVPDPQPSRARQNLVLDSDCGRGPNLRWAFGPVLQPLGVPTVRANSVSKAIVRVDQ